MLLDRPYFQVGNRVADNPVELIGDKILTAAAASVSFDVPVGYGILLLSWHDVYGDRTDGAQTILLCFNSDTAGNYDASLAAFGSASSTVNANTNIYMGYTGHTDTVQYHANGHMVIFNRSAQEKVAIGSGGYFRGDNEDLVGQHYEGKWRNTTTEISIITIAPSNNNFAAASRFILMGVKI